MGWAAGCSSDTSRPDGWESIGGSSSGDGALCAEGEQRACGLTLELDDGSMTCYRGTKNCEDGAWSKCQGGDVTREPLPAHFLDPGDFRIQSLSSPATCKGADVENPCDPACMYFNEDPDPDVPLSSGGPTGPITVTARTCASGVCTASTSGMDATCDPCANAVCASHSTCCTTAWTSQCVDWAAQICNGVTTTSLGMCDLGLYSESIIDLRNRPNTKYSIIASHGDVNIQTDSDFGTTYSEGNITVASLNNKNVPSNGGLHANGNISFQDAGGYTFNGVLEARGSISFNNMYVNGNVWAGTNITGMNTAKISAGYTGKYGGTVTGITGTTTFSATAPAKVVIPSAGSIPTLPVDCTGTTNWTFSDNAAHDLSATPGTKYGTVTFGSSGTDKLILVGQGTYYFNTLGNFKTIVLNPNGAAISQGWDLRVCNALANNFMKSGGIVTATGTPAQALDSTNVLKAPNLLSVYINGTTDVFMDTDIYFSGLIMAPNAKVQKQNINAAPTEAQVTGGTRVAPINGNIWAKQVYLETDNFVYPMTASQCKAIPSITGYLPGACSWDSGMKGTKTEPCSTGQDCQVNSTCKEPITGIPSKSLTCAHSKCLAGTKLSSTCDACVKRVCAVDPSCCETAWTSSCVAKVATVCDAVCGATKCTMDPCTASTSPMDATCDDGIATGATCIDQVCATSPSCCSTAWTSACITTLRSKCPTTGTRLCDYAAYGTDGLSVASGVTFDDPQSPASSTTVTPAPTFPTINFNCAAGTSSVSGTATLSTATHYNTITTGDWSGQTITISSNGNYYMNSLSMGNGTTLNVTATGPVNLYVCGKVYFGQNVNFNGFATTGTSPLKMRIYSNYAGSDAIYAYSTWANRFGLWVAPYGSVRLGDGNKLYGGVWAKSGTFSSGTGISAWASVLSLESNCKTNNLDGGPGVGACPVVFEPPAPPSSGMCVDNAAGYTETGCAGYDLAVGIPCDNDVPICNHGTAALTSKTVTIGYYHPNLAQLAVDNPLVSPTGTCSQTMTIAAGECQPLTCAIPTDATYSIMVDPNKTLSECDGRRLDNWSADDGRSCSSGSGATYEDTYTPNCPNDTSAQWKYLAWNTTTPGSSELDIYAQVVSDLSTVNDADYVLVGTASTALGTADCPYVPNSMASSPCFANLETALGLSTIQGQYLALKVEGTGSGANTPVLEDWDVIYTCGYDQ